MVAAERPGLPPPPPRGDLSGLVDTSGARAWLAGLVRRIDEHPVLHAVFRAMRKRLPGDDRFGDPLSVAGDEAPGVLGQRLALLAGERPSALKELGFSALQVWQSLSEAQGRGRGDEEVAILFTDLSGFSNWALDAGDTLAVELLRRVAKQAEPCLTAGGGRIVKRMGDGLMAVFDDTERAVAAAIAAREAVAGVRVDGYRPRLRAGVHVGRPRVLGGDYLGVDVNVAARVAQAAGPGEVLISDIVRARLPQTTAVRRKWRFSGKGTPAGMKAYAVE